MTVMVPFSHVTEIGLRKVTRNGEVARVLGFLSEGSCKRKCDWKDRFKENSDKMRNGSLPGIAGRGTCLWNFGNNIAGVTTHNFGRDAQYGTADTARYGGTLASKVMPNPALAKDWTLPARLARVRIAETARNSFELEVP